MKIVTIIGARPQFIKAAALSRAIKDRFAGRVEEILIHTGQHHDDNMSKVFFDELDIPDPRHHLGISGGRHGEMTGRMLGAIEAKLIEEKPDWVLIYGDTNSTLAGALAAVKLHIPLAHVEAGLRSFNMRMPEEVNRIVSDRFSTLLFCPTATAVVNLAAEGITKGVHNVGDVMYDVALFYKTLARQQTNILARLGLEEGRYLLATCHRAENTDDPQRLSQIMQVMVELARDFPVVFPLHPRTRDLLVTHGLSDKLASLKVTLPLPFLDMVALEQSAHLILTDSGGVQKEAYFFGVPCVTMRDETEWIETVSLGWNKIAGADKNKILAAVRNFVRPAVAQETLYGTGDASGAIIQAML
ncbi:UDP-N-acetylglucosamine 2-epimerase (non-hydrolyzing) [Bradyrhizobium sediminis]|uniref:UDP-N-acetylglucosamine 2-epimerase (Non-hydrolyzing) n=1 Tax=Bradyrhizobium sediminis TaxID=2840469 RepID=A0A975RNN1_9BRAD|nr:UDP-N-acetylglucosamine 2-epimerase (non-hydrolyzing) [Bradyrhizobium sediminis]QWG14892.1 UDP-N-acetylglucosamine 2-epimerase (non-hydrolyzing) [Bradyrhizobium sediminis]